MMALRRSGRQRAEIIVVTPAVTRSKSFGFHKRGDGQPCGAHESTLGRGLPESAIWLRHAGGERSRVRGGSMIADSENGSFIGTRNGRLEATSLVCGY